MEESVLASLDSHGKDYYILNSFRYLLPGYVVSNFCDSTTLHLNVTGRKGLKNKNEYYEYLAIKMLRNRCRTGLSLAFRTMNLIAKSENFALME